MNDEDMSESFIAFEYYDSMSQGIPYQLWPSDSELEEQYNYLEYLSPWKKFNAVTTLWRCDVTKAKALLIFDISDKLRFNDNFDIGGVFIDGIPQFWFFYTTSTCPGNNHLMNIFVCHKSTGTFTLGISNTENLLNYIRDTRREKKHNRSDNLEWFKFKTIQQDTVHYIKTFSFTETDRTSLTGRNLVIPITINNEASGIMYSAVLDRIKKENGCHEDLLKCQPDFILKSASLKEYRVHKIVLAAHSAVIRNAIRPVDCSAYFINKSDNEVELLIQYLYTGIIKDIEEQNFDALLGLANEFELENLELLVKDAVRVSINASNAISLAVIAEKYNNKEIQEIAFQFIRAHPETMQSEAFSQIENSNLFKKLLKYIHVQDE